METLFTSDAAFNADQIKDTIHSHISKTKAILTCAMFAIESLRIEPELSDCTLYYALWAAEDNVDHVASLLRHLEKLATTPNQQNPTI